MKPLHLFASSPILLFAALALPSCSSGGGGGPHSACQGSIATTLAGDWQVSGTLLTLDEEISSVYVPNGLDDATLHLEFGAVEPQPGPSDSTVCSAAYLVTSPTLDTSSPTGNPSSLFAGAVSNLALVPEGVFTLSSTPFYFPAGDVSVTVDGIGDLTKHSDVLFEYSVSFEVYAGQQVTAVVQDEPGIDDDGDGQIDEPDESEPGDGIAPEALLICSGTMKLSFARVDAGLAAAETPQAGLEIRGRLLDEDGAVAGRATLLVLAAERRVRLAIDGLDAARGSVRIEAALWPDGGFDASRVDAGERLRLHGSLAEDLVPEATLTIANGAGEKRLRFARRGQGGAQEDADAPAGR